jgi:hypothetical protein
VDCAQVEHPLYWVNVLRGRVEAEQLHRLHRLLLLRSPSSEEWIAEFIKARGLAGLFDVHENLFWRYVPAHPALLPHHHRPREQHQGFTTPSYCRGKMMTTKND